MPPPTYDGQQLGAGAPELAQAEVWQRLDPRMLLVHPVREVLRFLPAVIGLFVAGAATGGGPWQLIGVGIPVLLGVLRYLTTSFRIHGERIELRRGLLNRHVLSTPIDRVRTVDLTSTLIHRVLGLTMVTIGTGTASTRGDDRLDLDALPSERARELRAELLEAAPEVAAATPRGEVDPAIAGTLPTSAAAAELPAAAFTPAWLRFAPFTSSGLVIAAAVLGISTQLGDEFGLFRRLGFVRRFDPDGVVDTSTPSLLVVVPLTVIALVLVISALAVVGYLLTNWGFALTRTVTRTGGAWHVTRGLLTTRETTLDLDRVAGVVLGEPPGLRLAGGRRLDAIITGLSGEKQSGALLPPAPRGVVEQAAVAVIGPAGPITGPLVAHGHRAVVRRWTRALVPASVIAAAAIIAVTLGATSWSLGLLVVLPIAAALAADRVRALGHALVDGYVVSRSGSLTRRRSALGVDHVIGWNLSATWWQRRAGLTTLVATTAGGSQSVVILDIPEALAVELAIAAQPGLVDQFIAPAHHPETVSAQR